MPTDTLNPAASNRFSWRRVALLSRYYTPLLRLQIPIYAGISIIFALLLLIPFPDMGRVAVFTLVWGIAPFLVQLAPCALGRKGYGSTTDHILPAKASEKMAFFAIYFLVAVPLTVDLLPSLAELLILSTPSMQTEQLMELIEIQFGIGPSAIILNSCAEGMSIMVCLYMVCRMRSNKVLMGVVGVLATQFFVGLLGGIIGGYKAFSEGFADGYAGKCISDEDLTDKILESMMHSPVMTVAAALMAVLFILSIVANYRLLRKQTR